MGSQVRALYRPPRRSKVRFAPTIFCLKNKKMSSPASLLLLSTRKRSAPTQRTSFFLRGRRFFLLVGAAPAARKRSMAFADCTCSRRRFFVSQKTRLSPVPSRLLFGEKTVPAASGLSPCGRRSLSLFSDCSLRSQKVKVKGILSDGALCAPSLISHSSFLIALFPPPGSISSHQGPLV